MKDPIKQALSLSHWIEKGKG